MDDTRGCADIKQPSVPCARCGRLLWPGHGTLPPGRQTCHPCRRLIRAEAVVPLELVRCHCGIWFGTRHPTRRSCSDACVPIRPQRKRSDPRNGRPWRRLTEQVRAEEPTCWLCGGEFIGRHPAPFSFTVDHVIPLSKGGALMDRVNVRAAHFTCNNRRGSTGIASCLPA